MALTTSQPEIHVSIRRLLNRAVSTSLTDASFMAESNRISHTHPAAFLSAIVASASLDVEQAVLMHGLLLRLPSLAAYQRESDRRPMIFDELRSAFMRTHPDAGQKALLLFMARLSQHSMIDDALHGLSANPSGSSRRHYTPPLIDRKFLLAHVLVPLLRSDAYVISADANCSRTVLDAVLQILSARPIQLTAQQLPTQPLDGPLTTTLLVLLLCAMLELVELRSMLEPSVTDLVLRCTSASVQLLLPRARTAPLERSTVLAESQRQWASLSWRTQLHVWPLIDRLRRSEALSQADGATPEGPGSRTSAGTRFAHWLENVNPPSSPSESLFSLVVSAAVRFVVRPINPPSFA